MKPIGIYHQIDSEVLDLAAQLRAKGTAPGEIKRELIKHGRRLGVSPATASKRTQVAKSSWSDLDHLVEHAASLYAKVTEDERLALHVSVVCRAYPFFFDVLDQVGTQLRLNDRVQQGTVRDRIERMYGSKANVYQAVQKVVQTLVSWGALQKAEEVGLYYSPRTRTICPEIAEILIGGVLEAMDRSSGSAHTLRDHPSLFMFEIPADCAGREILHEYMDGGGRRTLELSEPGTS